MSKNSHKVHRLIHKAIKACNSNGAEQDHLFTGRFTLSSEETGKLLAKYSELCNGSEYPEEVTTFLKEKLPRLVEVQKSGSKVRFVPVKGFRGKILEFLEELPEKQPPPVLSENTRPLFG